MKVSTLLYIISLVLATCALFYSSKYNIIYSLSSSSSLTSHFKEQTQGDLTHLPYPIKEQGGIKSQKSKVIKEEMIESRKGGLGRKVRVILEDEIEDLTYHIDYHGVTTHPTPTPKHPKVHGHEP